MLYMLQFKGKTGSLTSKAIVGFTIPVKTFFDKSENIKALQQIMQS
jgi:hypothetical protein